MKLDAKEMTFHVIHALESEIHCYNLQNSQVNLVDIVCKVLDHQSSQADLGGGKGTPPRRSRKNCCRKMVLFPNPLFSITNFQKIIIKCKFSIEFSKFSRNFPTICLFVQTAKNERMGLLNLLNLLPAEGEIIVVEKWCYFRRLYF